MPKARRVAVIPVNTTDSNTCIRQLLPMAEMYEVELESWHYHTTMDQDCEDVKITFQPISLPEIKQELKVSQMETTIEFDDQEKVEFPLPKYGPHPNIKSHII